MRPISREYDETRAREALGLLQHDVDGLAGREPASAAVRRRREGGPVRERNLSMCVSVEELSWGDAGLYLSIPNPGLGGAAVAAAGTPGAEGALPRPLHERRARSGAPWRSPSPAAAPTSAAIQTTAVRDGDHWVLNGTKIFCTSGLMAAEKSDGFVVVWATLDKSAGRAGINAFVVERGHAGHVRHQGRAQARHPRLRHGDDRVRGLPHPARQHPRQRRDPEDQRRASRA